MPIPPPNGPSPGLFACGGAQRGISLATGFFAGESRRKPLRRRHPIKYQYIRDLHNHDLDLLDSFSKSTKSSLPNPPGQIQSAKHLQNGGSARDGRAFALCQIVTSPAKGTRPEVRRPHPPWRASAASGILSAWSRCRDWKSGGGDSRVRETPMVAAEQSLRLCDGLDAA